MYEMTLPSGTVVSVSAANKKQVANAEILFGKNAKVLIKKIDELVKIKELDTAKLSAILDLLNDADATTAFAKKAAGKNLVTAVKNLYKAKTLVAVINGLRAIKIKPAAANAVTPAKATPTKVSAKGPAPTVKTKVVASRVDVNADLPDVNLARITPKFMATVSQSQIDAIAQQLSDATSLTFVGVHQPSNGQSSEWTFEAQNPNAKFKSISVEPPFEYHEYMKSGTWAVSGVTKGGLIAMGSGPLKRPTVAAIAKEVKHVLSTKGTSKAPSGSDMFRSAVRLDFMADGSVAIAGSKHNIGVMLTYLKQKGFKFNKSASTNMIVGMTPLEVDRLKAYVKKDKKNFTYTKKIVSYNEVMAMPDLKK